MKYRYFGFLTVLITVFCLHGESDVALACTCDSGYTGEYCDIDLTSYSGDRFNGDKTSSQLWSKPLKSGLGPCVYGITVYHNICVCNYGYTGQFCEKSLTSYDIESQENNEDRVFDTGSGQLSGTTESSPKDGTDDQEDLQESCVNGQTDVVTICSCNSGFTGEHCEIDIESELERRLHIDAESSGMWKKSSGIINLCVNGITVYRTVCTCNYGYTGKFCDESLDSGSREAMESNDETNEWNDVSEKNKNGISGSGLEDGSSGDERALQNGLDEGSGVSEDVNDRVFGSGLDQGSGVNEDVKSRDYGNKINEGSGFDEDFDAIWSHTPLDNLQWELIPRSKHASPLKKPIKKDNIFEGRFAVISTGLRGTKTDIHVAKEDKNKNSRIYRFSFVPDEFSSKSRLELTTCFTPYESFIRKFDGVPKETDKLLKTSCPVSQLPSDHIHIHEYEIYIPKDDFDIEGQYVITQWHGSPNPGILRDKNRCIAQVSAENIHKLCSKGSCAQGEVFDSEGRFIGINYNQGGYPPLSFTLHSGYFLITARSDERTFIEKGSCSSKGLRHGKCNDHPRQQIHNLWQLPAKGFRFDEWVKFRWEIKWSEYSTDSANFTNPGLLTSKAWIRVWMGEEKIIDWIGPCGRNDENRIPYFKIGIYNPSGNLTPIRFFVRRYRHHHIPMTYHSDHEILAKNLTIYSTKSRSLNKNKLKSAKKYRFAIISSASTKKCVLYAQRSYLDFLTSARLNKIVGNQYTKQIITHLIYALEDQHYRIKSLEDRLISYENFFKEKFAERTKDCDETGSGDRNLEI